MHEHKQGSGGGGGGGIVIYHDSLPMADSATARKVYTVTVGSSGGNGGYPGGSGTTGGDVEFYLTADGT